MLNFDIIIFKKTYYLIQLLAGEYNEIICDIIIDDIKFNTIELKNNKIYLNIFKGNLELKNEFNDFELKDKINIYNKLKNYLK